MEHLIAFGIERLRLDNVQFNLDGVFFSTRLLSALFQFSGFNRYLQLFQILMEMWAKNKFTSKNMADNKESGFAEWTGTLDSLVKAIQFACVGSTLDALKKYNTPLKGRKSQNVAIIQSGKELTKAAGIYRRAYVADKFYAEVVNGKDKDQRSPQFQTILEDLLELYLIQTFFHHLNDILRFINISDNEIAELQVRLTEILKKVEPYSRALGPDDGDLYDYLFDAGLKYLLEKKTMADFFEILFTKDNVDRVNKSKL